MPDPTTKAINRLLDGLHLATTAVDVLDVVVEVVQGQWPASEPRATTATTEKSDPARTAVEVRGGSQRVGTLSWRTDGLSAEDQLVVESLVGIASMACQQRLEAIRQRVHASEIAAMHQVMEGVAAATTAAEIARSSLPVIVDTFGWEGGAFVRPDPAGDGVLEMLADHGVPISREVAQHLVATGTGLRGRLLGEDLPAGLVDALVWPIHRSTEASLLLYVTHGGEFQDGPGETLVPIAQVASVVRAGLERVEQEKLQRQAVEAERASQAKSEFLSRMSHELRTPLNAVLGFAQLLELDELPEEAVESVDQIRKAGAHLLDLVNEVLDIARIEAGRMSLSLEPLDIGEVVGECVSLVQSLADHRGVRVIVDDHSLRGRWVTADRQRTKQVLLNLLSNAVKYNRADGRVDVLGRADEDHLVIAVRDTGMGLTAAQVDRLFTPFERLGAEHDGVPGTGLGLALSQRLAVAMRGELSAESVPGDGTTLLFRLPATTAEVASPHVEPDDVQSREVPSSKGCVLYVEDNRPNRRLVAQILRRRPAVTLLDANTAADGIAIARAVAPDLVLLDLDLPDGTGEDVLKALQADPRTSELPVVIVSADASRNRKRSLMEAGALDYLAKPFNISRMLELVDEHLGDRPADLAVDLVEQAAGGVAVGPGTST